MALHRRAALLLGTLSLACQPAAAPTTPPQAQAQAQATAQMPEQAPDEAMKAAAVENLARSPYLELLRLERLASEGPSSPEAAEAHTDPAEDAAPQGELAAMIESGVIDEHPEGEEEVRTIVVRATPFATYEDLFRYGLRAMDKTPRTFHPTRALARLEGLVRIRETAGVDPSDVRGRVRALVRERRPAIKACIAQELRHDPRILLDEPSGLVFEQALRLHDAAYRFALDVRLEGGALRAHATAHAETPVAPSTLDCLGEALTSNTSLSATASARAHAPVVVFVQEAVHAEAPSPAQSLAMQAATRGWLHYERGEFLEARESFKDAAWAYHLPEYQALVGRAEDALGRPQQAIAAYQHYVDERPDAPETAQLVARIEQLRATAHAEP